MFNFLKRSEELKNMDSDRVVKLKLSGMHCSSCAVNIDLALEDVEGVVNAKTNFARSITEISYDPNQTNIDSLIKEIDKLGYQATPQ